MILLQTLENGSVIGESNNRAQTVFWKPLELQPPEVEDTNLMTLDGTILTVNDIPDAATGVELFRDTGTGMVKLTDMEITPKSSFSYSPSSWSSETLSEETAPDGTYYLATPESTGLESILPYKMNATQRKFKGINVTSDSFTVYFKGIWGNNEIWHVGNSDVLIITQGFSHK